MRPGRLDKLLYVGIAQLAQDKVRVLQALTRKFTLSPDVNLLNIAEGCNANLTGADLYALCADAWMAALRRIIAAHKVGPQNVLLFPCPTVLSLKLLNGPPRMGGDTYHAKDS